jgi:hypothetical protein
MLSDMRSILLHRIRRLLDYGTPNPEDHVQALVTEWRIGDRADFLDHALSTLEQLASWKPTDEILQLFTWGYQEALVQSRAKDAERLRQKLAASSTGAEGLKQAAALSATDRFEPSFPQWESWPCARPIGIWRSPRSDRASGRMRV